MYEKWFSVLRDCALFQGVNDGELESMLACMVKNVSTYRKDDCIRLAGASFDGVGIIVEGSVVITKENAAGDRVIINLFGPGELFGELAAFSVQKLWPATVTAQGEVTVIFIPPSKIVGSCERACPSHRMLIANMLKIVSDKALGLRRQMDYLAMKTLRGKISAYLLEQYRRAGRTMFVLPLKRDELADFLNVTRPSLSREMCRMRDEGLIDFHRSSVLVKDVETLRHAAQ